LNTAFNALQSSAAATVAAKLAAAQARSNAAAALLATRRAESDAALAATITLRTLEQAALGAHLSTTGAELTASDTAIENLQTASAAAQLAHINVMEQERQNALSVVCNSTTGICDYDDTRNPDYPLQNGGTNGGQGTSYTASGATASGRRLASHVEPHDGATPSSVDPLFAPHLLAPDDAQRRMATLTTAMRPGMTSAAEVAGAEEAERERERARVLGNDM
jgi:hypothetical protein